MEAYDVFILTGEVRDEDGKHELRFYGRNAELGPVLLHFDQHKPVFFVDAEEKLPALECEYERKPLQLATFGGRAVEGLYFSSGADQRAADERFRATGVRHFEADVRPPERFLMERFINGMARVAGEHRQDGKIAVFDNPKIKASSAPIPELSLVSLDIETGVTEDKLYSIGLHYKRGAVEEKCVYMLADRHRQVNETLTFFPTQGELLKAFFAWMAEKDPDLLIGWHVVGFDLLYLERRCKELSLKLDIARGDGRVTLVERPSGSFAEISGRVVLDGIPALRGCGFSFPNFKLETVARSLLHTGKLIASDHNKVSEIERQFREDKESLARYNLEDCVLVTDIFEKVQLIPLMLERTLTSGQLLGQLGLPTAALDHYYLPRLHRRGLVAPAQRGEIVPITPPTDRSQEPKPGCYRHAARLDFVNVLPSLVRVFKIDPLALAKADIQPQTSPSGHRFSATEHLLPELFEQLMQQQAQAKAQGNLARAQACGLTMDQICAGLAHKNCRFYEQDLLLAQSAAESWLVRHSVEQLESAGYEVVFADREVLLVHLAAGATLGGGHRAAQTLNEFWQRKLKAEFGLSSIEVAYRCHYENLLIPPKGRGEGEVVRRYIAQKFVDGESELVIEGLESLLSDWTELARNFCEEMVQVQFSDAEGLEAWLRRQIERLKHGEFDQSLVYRKKILKDLDEYGKTPPPHIRAARLMAKPGREVRYVYTKRGPEPVELNPTDLDYDHYLTKQLEPVADLVLGLSDKKLSKLEEPEQLGLF